MACRPAESPYRRFRQLVHAGQADSCALCVCSGHSAEFGHFLAIQIHRRLVIHHAHQDFEPVAAFDVVPLVFLAAGEKFFVGRIDPDAGVGLREAAEVEEEAGVGAFLLAGVADFAVGREFVARGHGGVEAGEGHEAAAVGDDRRASRSRADNRRARRHSAVSVEISSYVEETRGGPDQ